jgi:hypothetical protein
MRNLPAIFQRDLIRLLRLLEALQVVQESVRSLKLAGISLLDSETARRAATRS